MTTTDDTDALKELLWDVITEIRDAHPRSRRDAPTYEVVTAILPIVRKAQADVLRDAAADMGEWAGELILVTGDATDEDTWTSQTVGEWLHVRAEQIEKETPDA